MKFSRGQEMFETLLSGQDLYSPSLQAYVFLYSEAGSICVYTMLNLYGAAKIDRKAQRTGERWSALLGNDGCIYDEPINHRFCDDFYDKDDWIRTEDVYSYAKTKLQNLDFWVEVERLCDESEADFV